MIRRRTWNDWTKVEFSDLFASPPRNGIYKSKEFQGYGTPLVKMNELFRLSFISLENCYFEKISLTESEKQKLLLADQDLLFSRTSVVADGVGKCSLIRLPKSKELIFDSNIIRIRLNQKEAIPLFYFYYFLSPQGRNKIKAIASGAAVTTVTGKNLSSLEVPHPSIPIQRKIAAILSAYDDLIENNTRRIEIVEEMARSIYREWFVKFRFPGHEQVQMVDSELGLIPEGWEVKQLSEVCQRINYGYTAKAQAEPIGLKLLRITDIVPHLISWDSVPYCEISDKDALKFRLEDGDIVIARTGATVGYAKRLNKRHPESVFASYLVRIRINEKSNSHYIGVIVESDTYKDFIKANMSGAAQPQANAKVLTSFPLILPPKKLQDDFKNIVSVFFDHREILQVKNANLRQTRDLLLPRLISGEIDVENLDINTGPIAA